MFLGHFKRYQVEASNCDLLELKRQLFTDQQVLWKTNQNLLIIKMTFIYFSIFEKVQWLLTANPKS